MIDYDFEDRLIERIDARQAIRTGLSSRQQRFLRLHLQDASLEDIGKVEGVTRERARQIVDKSYRLLRRAVWQSPPVARYTPVGFDRRAFVDHMRHLRWMREEEERRRFERERARLAIMVQQELEPPPPPAPPVWNPPVQPGQWAKIKLPVQYAVTPAIEPARPLPVPSVSELRTIAENALDCFMIDRRDQPPVEFQGNRRSTVTFPRQGGILAHAMERLAHEVTLDGYLSIFPLELPATMLGATATNDFASVTVTVSKDLSQFAIHTPWYLPNAAS